MHGRLARASDGLEAVLYGELGAILAKTTGGTEGRVILSVVAGTGFGRNPTGEPGMESVRKRTPIEFLMVG